MKQANQTRVAEANARAAVAAQRTEVIDAVGQFLANEFNTNVGEFNKPNLIFAINGQQFSVTISAREKAISLDGANATFSPDA